MSRTWGNLTTVGKVVLPLALLLLVIAPILTILLALFAGPVIVDVLTANLPIVRFVVAVTAVLLMNLRIGPDRVGPFGSLLSVVHGLKVLMKEDFTPTGADRLVFTIAPVVVYMSAVMAL